MRRRKFILGSAAAALLPFAVRAQRGEPVRRVDFLIAEAIEGDPYYEGRVTGIREGLRKLGWIEGQNLAIEYRWAGGQTAKFRDLTDELIATQVEVIVTSGNAPALAAARATSTIPIVLASSADIISAGLVKSFSHPGGNVTGLTFMPEDTVGKRLELLKETLPSLKRVGVLFNPDANPEQVVALREVASKHATALSIIEFKSVADLDRINELPERPDIGALFVVSDPLVFVNRVAINQFALRERLPTIHMLREYVVDGGLLAYGPHFPDFFARAGDFVGFVGELPDRGFAELLARAGEGDPCIDDGLLLFASS